MPTVAVLHGSGPARFPNPSLHRAHPLLYQHVPELGARPPDALHCAQRRDQHAARQCQPDEGARGCDGEQCAGGRGAEGVVSRGGARAVGFWLPGLLPRVSGAGWQQVGFIFAVEDPFHNKLFILSTYSLTHTIFSLKTFEIFLGQLQSKAKICQKAKCK